MRETLVLVAVLVFLLWGLSTFKQLRSSSPTQDSPVSSADDTSVPSGHARSAGRNTFNQGAKSEGSGHQHHYTFKGSGARSGSPSDVAETENLPSIYSRKKQLSAAAVVRTDLQKQLIPGVPVQAFLDYQKNQFLPEIPVDTSPAMRVYLWCMEVKKKGLQYAGAPECQRIETAVQKNDLVVKTVSRN
jgi:hypothetical protein